MQQQTDLRSDQSDIVSEISQHSCMSEMNYCWCMAMTNFSSLSSSTPTVTPFILPFSPSLSVLVSLLRPWLLCSWFRASIRLSWFPCDAMRRDREGVGEKSHYKRDHLLSTISLAPLWFGHRHNSTGHKGPLSHLELCQASVPLWDLLTLKDH